MRCRAFAVIIGAALLGLSPVPAVALDLTPGDMELYTSVSIFPPTAERFTICYGFVCRRREVFFFAPPDRKALTDILAKGKASPEAERKAVQQAVVWFDRRVGPIIGTNKRIARADFRYFDDKHNSIATTRPATRPASCSCCRVGGCCGIMSSASRVSAVSFFWDKRRTTPRS